MDEHYDPDLDYAEPTTAPAATLEIDPAVLQHYIDLQRTRQHLPLAVVAGMTGAFIGAAIWLGITVLTGFQIGWMAVGVGLLVGMLIRVLGRGVDRVFGVLGAVLALLGCILGNVLSGCYFVAEAEGVSYLEALASLTPSLAVQTIRLMFAPADLLFYGIAVYEGYQFSFKRVPEA